MGCPETHVYYVFHHKKNPTWFVYETDLLNAYPSTGERVSGEGVSAPVLRDMLGPMFGEVRLKDGLVAVTYETREHRIATSR